ncbi:MAG: outer membrane lipoprotein carrier protein LolA [Minwuia sp.]|nr:outer membrane lipoprotein carrier protein LolA [Minwuia sp.]
MRNLIFGLVFAFAAIVGSLPVHALTDSEIATVQKAERWLESVTTLKARFVQVGGGGQAEGVMLLKRPGLIRFDYAPPSKVLLVSDGVLVSFVDYDVGQLSQWPLFDTPLAYLVRTELDLMAEADIDQVRDGNSEISFRLRDPENPEQGTITLQFAKAPYRLLGWRITDAQGQETAVALADLDINIDLPSNSFRFERPVPPWETDR